MLYLANFLNFGVTNYQGELAALSSAFLWAVGSVVWSRLGKRIPPIELNLIKGSIALVFLIVTLFLQSSLLPPIVPLAVGLLVLSGIIGIGIADTALFKAFNLLGPRRTLLLKILTVPTVALLALIFLQEKLTTTAWFGILLTIFGIAWVISERVPSVTGEENYLLAGIGWAIVSTIGDATGAVLSRAALTQTNIAPLSSTTLRLSAGMLVLLLWAIVRSKETDEKRIFNWQSILSIKLLAIITITGFATTYMGIWLQQISLKFAPAGIAQTLNATSPLFVLPIAIWMGEKVSARAILGVIVALVGVALLFDLV